MTRAAINALETRNIVEDINKLRNIFFERINKINKPLDIYIQEKRERTRISKILMKGRDHDKHQRNGKKILEIIINSYMPTN